MAIYIFFLFADASFGSIVPFTFRCSVGLWERSDDQTIGCASPQVEKRHTMREASRVSSPFLLLCLLTWRCCHGVKAGSYDSGVVVGPAGGPCTSEYVSVAPKSSFPIAGCYRKTTHHDRGHGFIYANYKGKDAERRASQPMIMWKLDVSFRGMGRFVLKDVESALLGNTRTGGLFVATPRELVLADGERIMKLRCVVGFAGLQGRRLVSKGAFCGRRG